MPNAGTTRRAPLYRSALLPLAWSLAACSHAPPAGTGITTHDAMVARPEPPLAYGDCAGAARRLAATPEMPVDRVPEPLAMKPAPFQKVPPRAWNRDGSAEIRVEVMVDTGGRADMTTFTPVAVSNPWFTQNLRTVMPRWRFAPARLAGCSVRRVYRFSATVPSRAERAKAARRGKGSGG